MDMTQSTQQVPDRFDLMLWRHSQQYGSNCNTLSVQVNVGIRYNNFFCTCAND